MSLEFKSEEERREYYKKRIEKMKREKATALKKRRRLIRQLKSITVASLIFILVIIGFFGVRSWMAGLQNNNDEEKNAEIVNGVRDENNTDGKAEVAVNEALDEEELAPVMHNPVPRLMDEIFVAQQKNTFCGPEKEYLYQPDQAGKIVQTDNMQSNYAFLVHVDSGKVIAEKDAYERISPASMTKILTVLVAAEHLTEKQLDEKVTITIDDTDYSYSNDCSAVGFAADEVVRVEDLLYGTILPSGGDAASALGKYIAGTREDFVVLMNEKLEELGLSESSHFTNSVGLYDENHYSTLHDIAVIMNAAVDNELCKRIMNAHTYTTTPSTEHPEGITISNWFLRRIEDKDTNGDVLYAKTGFVAQSGSCAASYQKDLNGESYICVTADAHSSWRCIYDHVDIYKNYTGKE